MFNSELSVLLECNGNKASFDPLSSSSLSAILPPPSFIFNFSMFFFFFIAGERSLLSGLLVHGPEMNEGTAVWENTTFGIFITSVVHGYVSCSLLLSYTTAIFVVLFQGIEENIILQILIWKTNLLFCPQKKSSYLGLKEDTMSILSHSIMFFVGSQDISGLHPEELVLAVQETSMKRLVVGPLDIRLHSSAAHRILKMITCAMDHEYEPYCKPQQGQSSLLNMWPSLTNSCFTLQILYFTLTIRCNSYTF